MIQFQSINKVYENGNVVLKDINLTIKEGEITVLIGPSGCGKTTTMKMINRLIKPTKGKITLHGKDISTMDPVTLRRKIGYVIQSIGLFPHMTIAKNVGVVPRLQKWEKQKTKARVDELLKMVNLDPDLYANRFPSELSGGQQQRIGVIRALAADPTVILMDEPFSALDPISREQLQEELIRLQQELKKTIVFVTHDMDEAIKIADTIILMKDGEVIQTGQPEQILRHPANDFVKNFFGTKRMHENTLEAPTVDEVMVDNPATAYPSRGLASAMKIMERRRVDSLLIVDKDNRLQGTVSIYRVLDQYGEETKTVADVMVPVVHFVQSGTSLTVALNIMTEHQLSNLPVVKGDNQLIGLITRGSVVSHLSEVYSPEVNGGHVDAEV